MLISGAAAWPLAARAQQPGKLPIVGLLGAGSALQQNQWTAAFLQRLREFGWIEGRTFAIEVRWAEGSNERAAEMAAELVRLTSACMSQVLAVRRSRNSQRCRSSTAPQWRAWFTGHVARVPNAEAVEKSRSCWGLGQDNRVQPCWSLEAWVVSITCGRAAELVSGRMERLFNRHSPEEERLTTCLMQCVYTGSAVGFSRLNRFMRQIPQTQSGQHNRSEHGGG